MKIKEIRDLTLEELEQKNNELKETLYNLRTQKQLGKLEKFHQLNTVKRDIARVKTILEEKAKGGE